ncbi:ankyrin repeats (3 copies) domain-containing protein [Trichoderma breve]|uniref:Ankyrin repeats (3 copies) domain-containing protein n=1 Tax=Trichoderma breve TaxID=2034170 RepID=A0A9W9E224_9HYPO|nr:ankyrin repeats (3 copies) domain-containing protein [Trichoderma breve]KAJ4855513.1 ankyrin repeats (3 copies) domain-containing protein [Trichoderma breve]
MSNPQNYTVGWICAIHTEYVAAQAFLDDKHEGPDYISSNDNNDYTLGRIGRHNVVIAVLPNGEHGLSSAASVARDMLYSFPNVRIGLMVGIGGGAPSLKHDIRLGDVVVGVPTNGKGGVIQYNFEKAIQGQEFEETGFLNQPPTLLRTAVGGLMAQYESDGNQIREAVKSAIAKKPRLRRKYMRPEVTTDRLYCSQIIHPLNNEADCGIICGDDLSNLTQRSNRDETDDDDPAIHYGLIASASTLMRNASLRDKLAKKDILCFETEAAGLMNHFPCLVIRGICDYSDTHINAKWQGYAAMTAAAYTKDLLYRIAPNRVKTEKKISNILSENLRDIAESHRDITGKHQEDLAKEKELEKQQKCHQLFRLTSNDKDTTYEWYKNRVEEMVKDTCLWFLNHEHYQEWLQQESGPLLVTADPGCGKSVLAKYLIDHDLIRKVESQFYSGYSSSSKNNLKYLLTCRPYEQITSRFNGLLQKFPNIRIPGEEESESISQEVNRVIIHRIKQLSAKKKFSAKISKYLEKKLQETTHRTYLWVYLVFDYLEENVFIKKTQKEIELIIKTHPKSINEAYEKILSKSQNEYMVRRALGIVLAASRPLTLSEMNIAMSINDTTQDNTTNTFDDLDLEDERDFKSRLRSLCGLFISIYHDKVYFLHQTAREFLLVDLESPAAIPSGLHWHNSITNRQAHNTLAELSSYYGHHTIVKLLVEKGADLEAEDNNDRTPLSWAAEKGYEAIVKLLVENGADIKARDRYRQTPLSWAAEEGHEAIVKLLIEKGASFKAKDKNGLTPLLRATINGHEAIVKLLVEKGANIRVKDEYGQTPLLWAAEKGYEAIVKLLVEKGANIEARNKFGQTSLLWAVEKGYEAIVKLLTEKGADLEAKDDTFGRTPLLQAIRYGRESIIKVLIEKGADIEAKGGKLDRTPLLRAVASGQEAIVKLLVEVGADIEAKDDQSGRTPLIQAAINGYETIVKFLIEKGADIEAIDDENGWTSLSWAINKGNEAIIKLLVETLKRKMMKEI